MIHLLVDDRSRFFTEIPNRTDTEVEIFFASNKSGTFGVYIYIYLLFSLNIDRILSRVGKNGYIGKKNLENIQFTSKIFGHFHKKYDLFSVLNSVR